MSELNIETRADLETELSRMAPESLDPPHKSIWYKIGLALIFVLFFFVGFAIGTASAQEDDSVCAPRDQMYTEMTGAGYQPVFLGVESTQEYVFVMWVNEEFGVWMVHILELATDIECHIDGGERYELIPMGDKL